MIAVSDGIRSIGTATRTIARMIVAMISSFSFMAFPLKSPADRK